MTITVKSTRPETTEPAAPHPYRFSTEPKTSRWPLAFAALLAGIALYIKPMLPGWSSKAEAEALPENRADDAGEQPGQGGAALALQAAADQTQADGSDGSPPAIGSPPGSGDRLVDLQSPASFETIWAPEFEFIDYASFGPVATLPFRFAGAFMAANDNPAPGTGESDGNGPGGSDGPDGPGGPGGNEPGQGGEEEEQQNRAPRTSGPVYLADVAGCAIALIGLTDLLANAVDPDGDALSVRNITASSGSLTAMGGAWLFDPSGYGVVTIAYEITDGARSVMQNAYFAVVRNSISGRSEDDLLVGTECGDEIDGGDGHDNIDARGGSDIVFGGAGNDHIVAGAGADTVFAGLGNDTVFGGTGNDWISGGDGDDRLFGENGDDTLFGDGGRDRLFGGRDNDLLFGGADDDELSGDEGNDRLAGGDGNDTLHGGDDDDVVMGDAGADKMFGGDGLDTLSGGAGTDDVDGGGGDDTVIGDLDFVADSYDGGEGTDTLDYAAATTSVSFDLASGKVSGVETGTDTISNFEVFIGGSGDDHFKGNGQGASFRGGSGDDLFEFEALSGAGLRVAYEILDFMAGDRIRVSHYEIFKEVVDSLEDRFEDVYGDGGDDDLPILISHEYTGNVRRTLIEADLDNDDHYELAIMISGDSQVTVSETA